MTITQVVGAISAFAREHHRRPIAVKMNPLTADAFMASLLELFESSPRTVRPTVSGEQLEVNAFGCEVFLADASVPIGEVRCE